MDIRRLIVIKDTVHSEGGLPAVEPVTRVAACAVIGNPLADQASDQIDTLIPWGAELGERLVKECLAVLPHRAVGSAWTATSSMRPPSSTHAWASRCGTPLAAVRPSFHRMSRLAQLASRSMFR